MKKILFICTHNSARSQLAEALTNEFHSEKYKAYSAGTKKTKINPYVVKVLTELGIDTSHQRSKTIKEFKGQKFDYVVTVCDNAKEACPFFPGDIVIHKSFADPSKFKGTDEEILNQTRQIRDEIKQWINQNFK
jgi:arsenate reductase